jgi:hypothetical protein
VSSAYKAGSRAIQLRKRGDATHAEELWFTNRVRFMFLSAIRVGDFVYGTTGDFGPAFLTALNIKTGQSAWQHRGFGRASLLYADGKAIILDEDGDLALAKLTPEGATILTEAKIFDTTSWTAPTLVGTTLYARDREKIVALDLGQVGQVGRGEGQDGRERQGSVQSAKSGSIVPPDRPVPPALPGLSGTWKFDSSQSRVTDAAGLAGLIAAGAPPMLHITQPANGTLVVESPINEGHARIYNPADKTVTPAGQGGTITMSSQWVDGTLVSQGTVVSPSGSSASVKEVFSISADGNTLTVDVTTAASEEKTSSLKYTRIHDVGACETWPTPCKRK